MRLECGDNFTAWKHFAHRSEREGNFFRMMGIVVIYHRPTLRLAFVFKPAPSTAKFCERFFRDRSVNLENTRDRERGRSIDALKRQYFHGQMRIEIVLIVDNSTRKITNYRHNIRVMRITNNKTIRWNFIGQRAKC